MLRLLLMTTLLVIVSGCITGPPDYDDPGFYLGAGGSYSIEKFDLDTGLSAQDSTAISLRGGYRLHPHFAAEVNWDYFFGYDVRFGGLGDTSLEGGALTINGKGYLHSGKIQPYGLLGVGVMNAETADVRLAPGFIGFRRDDETAAVFRLGAGLEVHDILHGIVKHLPVFLFVDGSYWLPTDELKDYQFLQVTAGLAWKFGGHGDDHGEAAHGEEEG